MARLRPAKPSVSSFFPSEALQSTWDLRYRNLVLMVRMISYADMALVFLSNMLCNTVSFRWKDRTYQYMKLVATKVVRSIGADPIMLIQRAILAILLSKVSMSCKGSSVSLSFCKSCTSAETPEVLVTSCYSSNKNS